MVETKKQTAKYHRVHYRRIDAKTGEPSFEELCRRALATTDASGASLWLRPNNRIQLVADGETKRQILMNRVADLQSAVFGEICIAQENDLQALLRKSSTTQVQLWDLRPSARIGRRIMNNLPEMSVS